MGYETRKCMGSYVQLRTPNSCSVIKMVSCQRISVSLILIQTNQIKVTPGFIKINAIMIQVSQRNFIPFRMIYKLRGKYVRCSSR